MPQPVLHPRLGLRTSQISLGACLGGLPAPQGPAVPCPLGTPVSTTPPSWGPPAPASLRASLDSRILLNQGPWSLLHRDATAPAPPGPTDPAPPGPTDPAARDCKGCRPTGTQESHSTGTQRLPFHRAPRLPLHRDAMAPAAPGPPDPAPPGDPCCRGPSGPPPPGGDPRLPSR